MKIIPGGYTEPGALDSRDFLVVKLSSSGFIEWAKEYAGGLPEGQDVVYDIEQTADGGYVIGGRTRSFGFTNDHFFVIKTDGQGNLTGCSPVYDCWAKTYYLDPADRAERLSTFHQIDGGDYILGGYAYFGSQSDLFVMKTDSDGNIGSPGTWAKSYGTPVYEADGYVTEMSDGTGYIVRGVVASDSGGAWGAGGNDAIILAIDLSGTMNWAFTYGKNSNDGISDLHEVSGGYIACGNTYGPSGWSVYVMQIFQDGTLDWSLGFDIKSAHEYCYNIGSTLDGGYLWAGMTPASFGGTDALVVKMDSANNFEWANVYGGFDHDRFDDFKLLPQGYILAGYTMSFGAGDRDGLVIKADSLGDLECCTKYEAISYTPKTTNLNPSSAVASYISVIDKTTAVQVQSRTSEVSVTDVTPAIWTCAD